MIDKFGRTINYLRISVTDRCNLRCRYCMPHHGVKLLNHRDILSFEEIAEVAQAAMEMGITKIRLTGGEPLVRRGILKLVNTLGALKGLEDFAMTTNGILLSEHAQALADAGLMRVNVSLDTLHPDRYRQLTRFGEIDHALIGIEAAQKAGLGPVKLNCVIGKYSNRLDAQAVRQFGESKGIQVRLIRQMCFETGCFSVVQGGSGGDCNRCNRIRLSSDGKIRPCLFSDISFSVRKLGPEQAIQLAVAQKPAAGGVCTNNLMNRIGG
ncbi:MAG: radical SAM protein [Anaerohalosphaera sp.]|nr:radical SAM protein [Anaerohalosphaera sp.]